MKISSCTFYDYKDSCGALECHHPCACMLISRRGLFAVTHGKLLLPPTRMMICSRGGRFLRCFRCSSGLPTPTGLRSPPASPFCATCCPLPVLLSRCQTTFSPIHLLFYWSKCSPAQGLLHDGSPALNLLLVVVIIFSCCTFSPHSSSSSSCGVDGFISVVPVHSHHYLQIQKVLLLVMSPAHPVPRPRPLRRTIVCSLWTLDLQQQRAEM